MARTESVIDKARRRGLTVHGSIYPRPSPLQDADYAQVVADNQRKRKATRKAEEEAA